jgi:membrane associated rhomboid family serine protease/Zn-finger nucleic acid-binding protein
MFICPDCGIGLSREQNQNGIFWVCPQCGGRAVAVPLLRKTIGTARVSSLWSQAIGATRSDGKLCPICSRPMASVTMGLPGQTLELDVCKRCRFVWFDSTEYEAIPPPPPKPKEPGEVDEKELPQAAREALALYKVQQIAERAREETGPMPDEDWKTVPALFGLPVEMDSDPLSRAPWVTLSVALVIAIVSSWAFFDLKTAVQQFGLIPAEAWRYGGLTFLTSFFLHGGIWHLVSNLYFLIIFGEHVEDYLGRWRWLLLVALAAVTGDLLHILIDPRTTTPSIGASGGISGLIAFYALKFPHARLGILMRFGFVFIPRYIQFPAWCAFGLWLLLQFWGAHDQIAGFGQVSALAHLGGTAVGVALWWVWRKIELQPGPVVAPSTG